MELKALKYMQASLNTLQAGFFLRVSYRLFGEDVHDADERGHKIHCKKYKGKLYLINFEASL